jgi:hypothetical protein
MPRDVLLFLVLAAVLLNLVLLLAVAFARWQRAGSPTRPRPRAANRPSHARAAPRATVSTRPRPAAWSPAGVRALPWSVADRERARPIATPLAPDEPLEAAVAADYSPAEPVLAPPATGIFDGAPRVDVQAEAAEAAAAADAAAEAEAMIAMAKAPRSTPTEPATRRGRRFVLPRNDEDKGRTERAIEAFLGEPAPSGSTSSHRPRRRARRRGTPGESVEPLVLVAALGGFEQLRQTVGRKGAVRFAEAYGEALRATMRSGDHVTDLGQGRLQLVVHADEEGARAMMERARGVCEPWLKLAPVPLALRVRPMPDPRSGNGHRPDGHPDRRQPEERAIDVPPSGGGPAHATNGRPNEAEARRFASG